MAAETSPPTFSIGVTYWPRRAGFGWWREFDRGAVREELAHVAALGCDTVRFCLSWEEFQPSPQRVNGGALATLEQALDLAGEAGLRVVAALFPVAMGGALWLPDWANGADPLAQLRQASRSYGPTVEVQPPQGPPLLADGRWRANVAPDLFADERILEAQLYLIHELVGYFGAHTAIAAWQVGDGTERVRKPESADGVRAWFQTIADAIRGERARAPVLGVASPHALRLSAGPRPNDLAAACNQVGISADPPDPPSGERPNHARWVLFLHALAANLAEAPVTVTQLGMPTAPNDTPGWLSDQAFGRALRSYVATAEQQGMFAEQVLSGLQRDGAAGAWFAAYADYAPELWRQSPLDRSGRERTLGLVDVQGREKPAAAALRAFAAERRPVLATRPTLDVDPERYWRAPARELARLWREFIAD